MSRSLLFGLIILLLPACSFVEAGEDPFFEPGGLLQTDTLSYDVQVLLGDHSRIVVDIPFQMHNRSGASLYLIGCRNPHPPTLEKYVDGQWKQAYSAVLQMCLSSPYEIQAGEVRNDTLRVEAYFPGQRAAPVFETSIGGTYRLSRYIYAGPSGALNHAELELLPFEQGTSNTFELK